MWTIASLCNKRRQTGILSLGARELLFLPAVLSRTFPFSFSLHARHNAVHAGSASFVINHHDHDHVDQRAVPERCDARRRESCALPLGARRGRERRGCGRTIGHRVCGCRREVRIVPLLRRGCPGCAVLFHCD
ncbi:hypothetical protein BC827DRAFT_970338 [Russula dissimulans]|nr:hypothetical protein BC827DRAFT_970338 [Russula dissimulans]